jgi:ABC-type glutathione transport system ATPase component
MMFQDPVGSLSPRKTVRDLILEPFAIHRIPVKNREAKAVQVSSPAPASAPTSSTDTPTNSPAAKPDASASPAPWR